MNRTILIVRSSRRTRFLIPHFKPFPSFCLPFRIPLFLFLLFLTLLPTSATGDVGKLVLPVGMQSVSFVKCFGLTGTAELGDE